MRDPLRKVKHYVGSCQLGCSGNGSIVIKIEPHGRERIEKNWTFVLATWSHIILRKYIEEVLYCNLQLLHKRHRREYNERNIMKKKPFPQ